MADAAQETQTPAGYTEGSLVIGTLTGWLYAVMPQEAGVEGLLVRRCTTGKVMPVYPHLIEPFTADHEARLRVAV